MHAHVGEVPPAALVDLGRMLYFDGRLSQAGDISCSSCHALDKYGVDNEPTSPGHLGQRGGRNSPTTYNAALHIAQFWDGREPDVEAQAGGPILNPIEMAMPDKATVVARLNALPGYVSAFEKAFPGQKSAVSYENLQTAIGAFERGLLTPSPFDAFLAGESDALTKEQRAGLDTFVGAGCAGCHGGVAVGGASFQKLGLVKPYDTADLGRKEVTGKEADLHVFKVPSLRNITETGPYFHDGKVEKLPEAVRLMGSHQLGKDLTDAEVTSIVAFLGALTGEIPKDYVAKPALPE
jgi:cytochrome c peroxidase